MSSFARGQGVESTNNGDPTSAELSVWRNTLDHFDAIKIGLTATPAAHTKAYFTDVIYRYEYERAVREAFPSLISMPCASSPTCA